MDTSSLNNLEKRVITLETKSNIYQKILIILLDKKNIYLNMLKINPYIINLKMKLELNQQTYPRINQIKKISKNS